MKIYLENVEFVSMQCAKSSSVWAAGIRSVFIRYGFVVSKSDLKKQKQNNFSSIQEDFLESTYR